MVDIEPFVPRRRKIARRWLLVTVVVVVVAAVVGSVVWYEYEPGGPLNPYRVQVSQIIWDWGGSTYHVSGGVSFHAGTVHEFEVNLYCAPGYFFFYYSVDCNTGSVYILTPGFTFHSSNAPYTWASGDSGSDATVWVWVSFPTHSYSGPLEISLQ